LVTRLSWLLAGWRGAEVRVLEAIRVAFEVEDLGMMHEPVDHRRGDDVVAEDLAPAGRTACWR
jgi:hypothetical protein